MINEKISSQLSKNKQVTVAIDGRCGAGKTTLAKEIAKQFGATVIHIDDFYLPQNKRTDEIAGNIDFARLEEVLKKVKSNEEFSYRPYLCIVGKLGEEIKILPSNLTIVEGSYSCHPRLFDYCDLHIFLDISKDEQIKRITAREGEEKAKQYKSMWIPREEKYFNELKIKEKCEIKI